MTRLIHRPAPSDRSPPLIAHVEQHLGRISRGSEASSERGIQAVIVEGHPTPEATSYLTLGLSHHVLAGSSGRQFRQELLGVSYSRFAELNPDANLLTVAHDLLEAHRAALRGEVIGPAGPIVPGSTLDAYYCSLPSYFSDDLATFRGSVPATTFIWLIPISHAEAHYVWEQGWSKFEDLLVEHDSDLLDLTRPSLV
jgi:hypothetical protein